MFDFFKPRRAGMAIIYMILSFAPRLHAQQIVPGDTTYNKWKHSIVHIQSIFKSGQQPTVSDTLTGTGFLLTDNHKFYLATTKHLIKATLRDKEEQLYNNTITIRGYLDFKRKFNVNYTSDKDINNRAVAFTDDEEDIGIISLQKTEYKEMLTYLLAIGATPVPIQLIDDSNNHKADEWVFRYGYSITKNMANRKREAVGMNTCQIDEYHPAMPFFTIKHSAIMLGNSGSPVTYNDRLIGILSNASGIETDADIIKQSLDVISSAKVIKASYILSCLHKLQQMENNPAFNN